MAVVWMEAMSAINLPQAEKFVIITASILGHSRLQYNTGVQQSYHHSKQIMTKSFITFCIIYMFVTVSVIRSQLCGLTSNLYTYGMVLYEISLVLMRGMNIFNM